MATLGVCCILLVIIISLLIFLMITVFLTLLHMNFFRIVHVYIKNENDQ